MERIFSGKDAFISFNDDLFENVSIFFFYFRMLTQDGSIFSLESMRICFDKIVFLHFG